MDTNAQRLATIQATLDAQGTAIGEVQDGMAATVDANLANNAAAITTLRRSLNTRATKANNHQQGLVNQITGQLAQAADQAIASNGSLQSIIATPGGGAGPGVLYGGARPSATTVAPTPVVTPLPPAPPAPPPMQPPQLPPAQPPAPQPHVGGEGADRPPDQPAQPPQDVLVPGQHWYALYCDLTGPVLLVQADSWAEANAVVPNAQPFGLGSFPGGFFSVDDFKSFYPDKQVVLDPSQLPCGAALPPVPPPEQPPAQPPPEQPPAPPPQPAPQPQPPPPEGACTTLVSGLPCVGGALPAVGSEEWCQCLDGIVQWLVSAGQFVKDNIDTFLDPNNHAGGIGSMGQIFGAANVPLGMGQLFKLLDQFGDTPGQFQECLWSALKDFVLSIGADLGPKMIGISLCRTLLTALRRLRVGWDAALWLTVDLELELRPIEKLLDYAEAYSFQWEIPGVPEAIDCYLYLTAPEEQIFCWMRVHGANPDIYAPVIDARREKLTIPELIQYNRRNGVPDDVTFKQLRLYGFTRAEEAKARMVLYDELPSIAEHLHWLQRNVFDDQYVSDYGLMEGFEDRFWAKFGSQLYAQGYTKERAALEYAAHWINLAPGQLAELLIRLRPGRVDDSLKFTLDDYKRLLAEQDIAPYFRERLAYVAYRTLPLRQLNQAAQQGAFDEAELVQRWQDIGFKEEDAKVMAHTTLVQARRTLATQLRGYTPALVSELVEYNRFTKQQAIQALTPLGYTEDQVSELVNAAEDKRLLGERKRHYEGVRNDYGKVILGAYEEGSITREAAQGGLNDAGYDQPSAALALSNVDIRVQMETIKTAVNRLHKGYMGGEIDPSQANVLLQQAGVTQQMADTYVKRWSLERTVHHVAVTSGQILRWTRKGVMSVANAAARLKNLGWTDDNINLQIAELQQDLTVAQAKLATRSAKQLAQAQATARKVLTAAQKQSCRIYTPSKLVKWYATRVIAESDFFAKLKQCGYTDQSAAELFREAQVARAAKDAKAAKSGADGVEYTGSGADTGGAPG